MYDEQKSESSLWASISLKQSKAFYGKGLFKELNNDAVINQVFKFAGYTYGPLLGMFAFGLFSKRFVMDKWVPFICLVSPIVCYVLDANSKQWFGGYQFGNELLIANGLITFVGLMIISRNRNLQIV
jgi:hypothetical protein